MAVDMKAIAASPIMTNILLAVVALVGGLMGYIFNDHKNAPWHGTVGTDLVRIEGQITGINKDIEEIKADIKDLQVPFSDSR